MLNVTFVNMTTRGCKKLLQYTLIGCKTGTELMGVEAGGTVGGALFRGRVYDLYRFCSLAFVKITSD